MLCVVLNRAVSGSVEKRLRNINACPFISASQKRATETSRSWFVDFDSEGMIKEPHDNQETLSLISLLLYSVDCRYPPARFLISLGEGLCRLASGPGDCSS